MLAYGRSPLLLIVQQIHLVEQSEVVNVVINTQQLLVVESITLRTLGCRRNTERRSFIVQSLSPNSFSVVIETLITTYYSPNCCCCEASVSLSFCSNGV